MAQEAQVKAEQAQTLAEQAQLLAEEAVTNANNLTSTIDELRFNTLGCDIYKPTYPLKMITTFEPPFKTTHKAEERTFIKVDKYGKYTNITGTSTSNYVNTYNHWWVRLTEPVSLNGQKIIDGGSISISFYVQANIQNHLDLLNLWSH